MAVEPLHGLETVMLAWRTYPSAQAFRGLRLLVDAPRPAPPVAAVIRSIARANPRLGTVDALLLATHALEAARARGLDYGFFAATLLQESAFDPDALSSAGAIGIAQFTVDTAAEEGVNPFDWRDSIDGSARLLARYLAAYDGQYPDPYAVTLAAYNAGPAAVAKYRGVPPYPETQEYVADIYDRWSRIVRDASPEGRSSRRRTR